MMVERWRFIAVIFTATLDVRDSRVVSISPILFFMRNWDFSRASDFAARRGWLLVYVGIVNIGGVSAG